MRRLKELLYMILCVIAFSSAVASSSFSHFLNFSIPAGDDEEIPDSLLHPRWKIQKTAPVEVADLDSSALDLHLPENIKQRVEYDDSTNTYRIGSKMGDSYLNTPVVMTPEEYRAWSEKRELRNFFRKKRRYGKSARRIYNVSRQR